MQDHRNGKGHSRRKAEVPEKEIENNWARVFGSTLPKWAREDALPDDSPDGGGSVRG